MATVDCLVERDALACLSCVLLYANAALLRGVFYGSIKNPRLKAGMSISNV